MSSSLFFVVDHFPLVKPIIPNTLIVVSLSFSGCSWKLLPLARGNSTSTGWTGMLPSCGSTCFYPILSQILFLFVSIIGTSVFGFLFTCCVFIGLVQSIPICSYSGPFIPVLVQSFPTLFLSFNAIYLLFNHCLIPRPKLSNLLYNKLKLVLQ